jgi:hypothetical protein
MAAYVEKIGWRPLNSNQTYAELGKIKEEKWSETLYAVGGFWLLYFASLTSLQAITNFYQYYLPPISGGPGKTLAMTTKVAKKDLDAPTNKPSDVIYYLKMHTNEWRALYPAFQEEEELLKGQSLLATEHSATQRKLASKILAGKGKAWLAQMRDDRDKAFAQLSAPYHADLAARIAIHPTAEQYYL